MTSDQKREYLAQERTDLANERTFLAYIRTAVSIAALGIVMLHFLTDSSSRFFGIFALALAALIFLAGLWRFRGARNRARE